MIKGVIFDADGTLLDSMPMWKELDYRFLEGIGVTPDAEYAETVHRMTLEEGVAHTKKRFQLSMPEEEILEGIQQMAGDFYYHEARLKPYAREFLEALYRRKIPMAVATSSQKDFIFHALSRNQARHYFKEIFSCAEIGRGKLFPDIYLMAAEYLNIEPKEAWVFEDAHHALKTAKNAGFRVAAVYDLSNENFLEETIRDADLYLEDLRDADLFFKTAGF